MVGKRVIILKRPAVLCAAVFVLGIFLAKYSGWIAVTAAVGLFWGVIWFLRSLHRGRRRVSVADKLLLLAPVFLLLGRCVMTGAMLTYERDASAFRECLEAGREVLAEGTVSHIRWTDDGVRLELSDAVAMPYEGGEYRPVGTLLVYLDDIATENGELKYGQEIFVYGSGSVFEEASNPGGFDAREFYFSQGITGAVYGKTVRIRSVTYHRLHQALFQAKNQLLNRYVTYLGEEGAGVISSMLLGERALLSEETKELYRHGGISHILAISGLHVSLIGTALYTLLRKTILGRNGAIPVACGGVILYGTFVEAGISTKRAVIMFILLLVATILGRTYDTLSAMSVSVIVILCGSPGALYTASFQLSFAAAYGASVLAVLLRGTKREEEVTYSKRSRVREYITEKCKSMFLFGLAIQAVTFPFTVVHFFEYPTYGFFLNPVVVPLMTILLLCGLLSGVCGLFVPWFGFFFAGGARGILWIYEELCRWVEQLPGSLLLVGKPEGWQVCVYYALLAAGVYRWYAKGRRTERQTVVFLLLLFLPLCLLPISLTHFEAAFLDVGQGDGIVLREQGGAVLLVDGGSTSVQNVGEKRLIPYLKSQGIRVIDCAFVSHTDSDHMSGVREILAEMPEYSGYRECVLGYTGTPVIKRLVLPEWDGTDAEHAGGTNDEATEGVRAEAADEAYVELLRLAQEKQVEVSFMKAGDRVWVGKKLMLSCLAPEAGVSYDSKNAASMVLLASYGAFDLLLTGDMEKEGELRLLEEQKESGSLLSSVEVLKVSHHGSYTASSEEFISALQPPISVISCGKDNRYGHPHTETLETLYGANSRVYRTDENGCVTVKVGRNGWIQVERWRKSD
ncbi:MAG: DNA internalization-related competence protein ComEC/Rec2 [Lachnospiraceae bacterium]|nr:DNA internalization-related competence protein ComEC/Rec2 [Lachnospiraceae bacterium]